MLVYRTERARRVLLNLVLVVEKGVGFSTYLVNGLRDEETTVHWHGLHLYWRADGHPSRQVVPGAAYRYKFPVLSPGARTGTTHTTTRSPQARPTWSSRTSFWCGTRRTDSWTGVGPGAQGEPHAGAAPRRIHRRRPGRRDDSAPGQTSVLDSGG
jgi:hypothetical protein